MMVQKLSLRLGNWKTRSIHFVQFLAIFTFFLFFFSLYVLYTSALFITINIWLYFEEINVTASEIFSLPSPAYMFKFDGWVKGHCWTTTADHTSNVWKNVRNGMKVMLKKSEENFSILTILIILNVNQKLCHSNQKPNNFDFRTLRKRFKKKKKNSRGTVSIDRCVAYHKGAARNNPRLAAASHSLSLPLRGFLSFIHSAWIVRRRRRRRWMGTHNWRCSMARQTHGLLLLLLRL